MQCNVLAILDVDTLCLHLKWVCLVWNGCPWLEISVLGFKWVCWFEMGVLGLKWVYLAWNKCAWFQMGVLGFKWVCLGLKWVCLALKWVCLVWNGCAWFEIMGRADVTCVPPDPIQVTQCEIFLSMLVRFLDGDKPLWQRTLAVEVLHVFSKHPALLRQEGPLYVFKCSFHNLFHRIKLTTCALTTSFYLPSHPIFLPTFVCVSPFPFVSLSSSLPPPPPTSLPLSPSVFLPPLPLSFPLLPSLSLALSPSYPPFLSFPPSPVFFFSSFSNFWSFTLFLGV